MSKIRRELHAAWVAYINEFGTRETFTLLQLEQAMRLAMLSEVQHEL